MRAEGEVRKSGRRKDIRRNKRMHRMRVSSKGRCRLGHRQQVD